MSWIRNAAWSALLAVVCTAGPARAVEKDYEALFGALRTKVAERKPYEPEAVRQQIDHAYSHIIDCPAGKEPEESVAHVGIEGVEYSYNNIYLDDNDQLDGQFCFYIAEPLHRRLTAAEGRDFSAALLMPDTQRFMPGLPTAEELAARARIGEKHFAELRAAVASGIGIPRSPDMVPATLPPLGQLMDCSHVPFEDLDSRLFDAAWENLGGGNNTLYNDVYYWHALGRGGEVCVFLEPPLRRGLTMEEARDLLRAVQLDLGYSDEFRRCRPGRQYATSKSSLPPDCA
ncbi:MAG: hypothetical protein ACTHK2_00550 [Dokdonella sp.]|uniref:hypothetical protein n=1 Tax=Dokdonella sp. TaxID=2291710 RepID=UPI003F804B35